MYLAVGFQLALWEPITIPSIVDICFSKSCGIPDTRNEFLYITGNRIVYSSKQVTQYAQQGFTADLPDLITGRWDHACAGYNDDQDHFVLLVVGGRSDDDFDGYIDSLSSTEIYKVGVSFQWTEVSALPYELYGVRASTVTKRIYLTGEDRGQDAPIILIF